MPASHPSGVATLGRSVAILAALAVAATGALALALTVGSVSVDVAAIVRALAGDGSDTAAAIVRDLRLPRAVAAFAVGGLLALAGALMQVLLRNPLADPYILGISGGAAVGALGAMLAGASALVTPAALGGALASTVLVFGLARTGAERAPWTTTRLLLTGVVVAAGWGALIALMLTLAPDAQVKGMLFWLIGDLGGSTVATPALVVLAITVAGALAFARDLNVLARGDDVAAALGVDVARTTLAALRPRRARHRGRRDDRGQRRIRRARRPACAAPRPRQRPARAVAGERPRRRERCSSSPTRWRAASPRRSSCRSA